MKKGKKKNYFLLLIPAVVFVGVLIYFGQFVLMRDQGSEVGLPTNGETIIIPVTDFQHIHVDFKVFINGEEVNFNREEFNEANPRAHFHLNNPSGDKVIHFEGRPASIGFFFESLGMSFDSECFVLDTGESFCGENLKMFVNSEENPELGNYFPNDTDRVLITYGSSEDAIKEQIESVTDFACIFSGKCPERRSELVLPDQPLIL